ncbi:BZ3500_MvSof-1268-A1-R1_Chr1-1g01024 [Microbotryum saponariae]|uniref:BZ3500_MvSof-1268-A1-R1_Chr1-1g01024 protein n=1 Tax=Microbotryum saponariae TaxID=289078 RepID=A0A2X0KHZ1_9BASI|nr:BZ3500_MvSof-1268-A1-R1_Chr1-1g01024 [Microbotryum saponariae]SCZ93212.1 BZ3501_MvSof-1269-A2-R1_Chr1-1g00621 [Microbotryum saponariae]
MSNVCYDPTSGAPVPCGGFTGKCSAFMSFDGWYQTLYNSYVTDPEYQRYFTIAWTATLAFATLLTLPSVIESLRMGQWRRRSWAGLVLGISERPSSAAYQRIEDRAAEQESTQTAPRNPSRSFLHGPVAVLSSLYGTVSRFSLGAPLAKRFPRLAFPFGKLVLVLLIPLFYLLTLFPESQLRENPNRFGFLALAGLPPLFLLSSKNGAASWLLGKSWTTVNFLHRWLARTIVLLVLLHFYFWTIQVSQLDPTHLVETTFLTAHHPQYAPSGTAEFLSGSKERRGIGALSFLLLIAVSSAGPLRRYSYPLFFCLHYLGIIGFLTFVNMHTIYARTWATWSIGLIYAIDIFARIVTMRVKHVTVEPLGEGMTKIHIPFAHDGWRGGQHVQLRLFFTAPGRSFWSCFRSLEQHPFSIANASSSTTVLQSFLTLGGIDLYLRSCGPTTWTEDLYQTAFQAQQISQADPRHLGKKLNLFALLEGPYGGLDAFDPLKQETLLFLAGGSGMSFVLGTLDEVVGNRIRTRQGGRIEVVWVVHRFEHVEWFRLPLQALIEAASTSGLDLVVDLQIYVTTPFPDKGLDSETPFQKVVNARPNLPTLIQSSIDATLTPCRRCYPICRCADLRQDGMCGNDDEECVGSGTVANLRESIVELDGEGCGTEKGKKSCCYRVGSGLEENGELQEEKMVKRDQGSGCSNSNGSLGCCGAGAGAGSAKVQTRVVEGAIKVRQGGYKMIVCGPASMIVETRQTLSRIPLAKQVKLGGIGLHIEAYGV